MSGSVSSCNLCGKTFLDKTELNEHVRKRHTKRRLGWPALAFKCELCGAEDAGGNEFKDHIEGHHGTTLKRTGEKSNDQLSHNILRHDFICGRCDETYPDQNIFNHHSTKLHRLNVELISEINDEYENMAIIPCEFAEKDVNAKTKEEFISETFQKTLIQIIYKPFFIQFYLLLMD